MKIYRGNIVYSLSIKELVELPRGYIAVNDGKVVGTYQNLPEEYKDLEIIDYGECLIIPSFTDLHVHAPQYPNRGIAMDLLLNDWLNEYTFKLEANYKDKEFAKKVYAAFVNDFYKMTLWDTAGQDRFRSLPKKYYQNADGVFLLFDVNKRDTFENVTKWMKDVKENSNRNINSETGKETGIPIYLIGNKIDKPDREISREEAEKQAQSLGMKYFEVSCKLNMNINEVISRMVLETLKNNQAESNFKLKSGKEGNNRKGGCCGDGKKQDK